MKQTRRSLWIHNDGDSVQFGTSSDPTYLRCGQDMILGHEDPRWLGQLCQIADFVPLLDHSQQVVIRVSVERRGNPVKYADLFS